MARGKLSPPTLHPPPDLPSMPDVGSALTAHLRSLALWAQNGLASKLDTRSAVQGILLHANDAPAGTTPAVFSLEVRTDGTLVAVPVPLGTGTTL